MIECPVCKHKNSRANEKCTVCGHFLGFPNVNDVRLSDERQALEQRYQTKLEYALRNHADAKIRDFEKVVDTDGRAVINVDIDYLHYFLVKDKNLYAPYHNQVQAGVREYAMAEFDRERSAVDATLFGSYGKNIIDAALSIDGSGLKAYGDFAISLSEISVSKRATLLEENSYNFVRRHKILAGDKIPPGYRCEWNEKHRLAVAKLADRVVKAKKSEYPKLLVNSTGNRRTDDFIEVHIYGGFGREAIASVRGNSKIKKDHEKIQRVKELLKNEKKDWMEE